MKTMDDVFEFVTNLRTVELGLIMTKVLYMRSTSKFLDKNRFLTGPTLKATTEELDRLRTIVEVTLIPDPKIYSPNGVELTTSGEREQNDPFDRLIAKLVAAKLLVVGKPIWI